MPNKFERSAIVFYRESDRYYPCQILGHQLNPDLSYSYLVRTDSGYLISKKESDLLTGLEPEFPTLDQIERPIVPFRDLDVEEDEVEEDLSDASYDAIETQLLEMYDR